MRFNIHKATKIQRCQWCGHFFHPKQSNQKYCSYDCSYYSSLERNRIKRAKMREKKELTEKLLGSSNIREHRNKDFSREIEIVRKERNRILKYY